MLVNWIQPFHLAASQLLKFEDCFQTTEHWIRLPKRKMKPEVSFENGSMLGQFWYSGGNVDSSVVYKASRIKNLTEKGPL